MRQITIYNLKIKIISIQIPTTTQTQSLQLQMLIGQRLLDKKQIHFQHGLLEENITLQHEINQKDILNDHRISIILEEEEEKEQGKNKRNVNRQIGKVKINLQEFTNMKKHKFQLDTSSSDKKAFLQAFLLLIPTKIIDLPPQSSPSKLQQPNQLQLQLHPHHPQSQVKTFNSKIQIIIEQSKQDEISQSQEMTFNNHNDDQEQTYSQIQQQDVNYDSLITLNQILNQSNKCLEEQNRCLKNKVEGVEGKLAIIYKQNQKLKQQNKTMKQQIYFLINNQNKLTQTNKEIQSKLQLLQSKLSQKDNEIIAKNNSLSKLTLQNQELNKQITSLNKQILELNQLTKRQIRQQLKISDIVNELGKYRDAATKKIRPKQNNQNKNLEIKVPSIQMPKLTFAKSFFELKSERSSTQRNTARTQRIGKKVQLKDTFESKQLVKNDQTFDTTSPQIKYKSTVLQNI